MSFRQKVRGNPRLCPPATSSTSQIRRPKRKLCYLTNKERVSKQWAGTLTLGDVDRMFDDLDASSHDDDLFPPSPLLQISDTETNQSEREASLVPEEVYLIKKLSACKMGPEGDRLLPATRSPSPLLDIDSDIPFKVHGPVKTSSPVDKNGVVERIQEEDNEKKQIVSPILFDYEDEGKEEANTESPTIQKPRCNAYVTEDDDSELESLPSKVTFSKPMMSSHKKKVEESCKESHLVKEKTHQRPQTPVLERKRKTPRQENTDQLISAVRQEPDLAAPEKHSRSVHSQSLAEMSTRVVKDITAFQQKLRDAGQPKPACSRDSLSPVEVQTTPPVLEDDFLILEDDAPIWFSIPSKTATSKRQKQSRSTDKDSSTDKGTKDGPLVTAQKEDELEKATTKLGILPVNQKIKKKKGRETKHEVTWPRNDEYELSSPKDLPAGDLVEQDKPNKKKQQRLKKIPLKEAKEKAGDTAGGEKDEEKRSQKMEKKAQKSSEMKSSKSSEKAKTSRAKSLRGTRKVIQGSEDKKETVYEEAVKEQSKEQNNKKHADVEDLGSLSDKEIMNFDVQAEKDLSDEKAKQNKLPVEFERSSPEESQILGKQRRKQTGQWWLSSPQITEVIKVTDNQPMLKKFKQHNKEPSAAEPSPVKAKKDRVLKKRNQKQPVPSSSQSTIKAKEKKTRWNKNRPATGDTADKMKATDEVFNTTEAEQIEQQQEVLDQDHDPVHSSPLVFKHKDLSLNSGDQVFQRVYHHVSNEKISCTPAPGSPRRPWEQLSAAEPEKRRRKPPGNWWMVKGMCGDEESISSQRQQPNPKETKSCKEIKKQSKQSRSPRLGTPKNGNMAVSSKPLGGAHVPSLKLKPLSAPKTVKRSLATFKDIFTSATESLTVISSRDIGHNNRNNVTAGPAEQVTLTDCVTLSKTNKNILSTDAGEVRSTQNSPPHHDTPQDCKGQPEYMLNDIRSGPSSLIELEQYEEYEDLILPSSRAHAVLSVSDMCAPPLKPLILQPKDKANLTEWFKSLWSTTVDNGAEITPDHFDWYFYQGRAIGFLVDLNCGSICNGKILLGSYMKKPLWVDHSATTVFNLLTSSVSLTINGRESRFNPGQSFMVKCGNAYSIQNVTAQPAVLYFTRILAES
ncbi:ankyrin repeat domain-containing protein 11 isoform X2 [Xiphias gladius]|uniref:ankyrin repeat domain-containing protein 11 isoform X2 n=1 Tax=Xiphias gladius TaxID=8245 RepID=UPI001A99793F|nr:ankyrin repeat domain-containing protein 11 isoform X2 [Xiphias gladius]